MFCVEHRIRTKFGTVFCQPVRLNRAVCVSTSMDIETGKSVYLFTHGRADMHERAMKALESAGVDRNVVVDAVPGKTGQVGDYMAMLWAPPNPNHIKMQKITNVVPVEPEGMIGLWKGVSKDDIGTIQL